jgi:hypothetical protein
MTIAPQHVFTSAGWDQQLSIPPKAAPTTTPEAPPKRETKPAPVTPAPVKPAPAPDPNKQPGPEPEQEPSPCRMPNQ